MWLPILITVLTGYLLGNLNGAVMMSMMESDDVRKYGSGNAGLTNFVRNFGFGKGVAVIFVDAGKAVLACMVGKLMLDSYGYGMEGAMIGAVAVSLGHDFPVLLGFRGGKGIMCGLAIAAVIDYRCALLIFGVFLVFVLLTRYVSLGSVMGAVSLGIFFGVMYVDRPVVMIGGIFISVLALFMHRGNIGRLIHGTERKFSFRKKEKQS